MKWRENLSDTAPVDFDHCSSVYEELLKSSIWLSGENNSYFDLYKLNCLKLWVCDPSRTSMILDFGCGIGNLANLIAQAYPQSTVYGYDVSSKSIELAREKWGHMKNLVFECGLPGSGVYDLVVVANVFHHIIRKDRRATLFRLRALLKPGGIIAVFEHNPFNPMTVYTVKTCPFDADVELIPLGQFIKLALNCGLEVRMKRYIVFFPRLFKVFRRLEPFLGSLPLGAQYMVLFS